MAEEKNYFKTLYDIDVNESVKKKNGQNFLPWAKAWAKVKEIHPNATYHIYERTTPDGLVINYFTDGKTCWVKTSVTINGIEHEEDLACQNLKNQSILLDDITSSDVGKAIQRCLTKACARHGLGLYLYEGEDLPSSVKQAKKEKDAKLVDQKNALIELMGDIIETGKDDTEKAKIKDDVYAIISKYNGGKKNPNGIDSIEVCEKAIADIKKKYKEKK